MLAISQGRNPRIGVSILPCIGYGISHIDRSAISPSPIEIGEAFHPGPASPGGVSSIFRISHSAVPIPGGRVADRRGGEAVVVTSGIPAPGRSDGNDRLGPRGVHGARYHAPLPTVPSPR